jgi:hypothetical protein
MLCAVLSDAWTSNEARAEGKEGQGEVTFGLAVRSCVGSRTLTMFLLCRRRHTNLLFIHMMFLCCLLLRLLYVWTIIELTFQCRSCGRIRKSGSSVGWCHSQLFGIPILHTTGPYPCLSLSPSLELCFYFSPVSYLMQNLYHLSPTFCLIPTHSLKLNLYHPCHAMHSTTWYLSWQWQLAQLTHPCPFRTHHTAVSTHHITERDWSASSTSVLCWQYSRGK